jgi:hypothetical protein
MGAAHQQQKWVFKVFVTLKRKTNKSNEKIMSTKFWKTLIDVAITILTAIAATLTTTSCMGNGPF